MVISLGDALLKLGTDNSGIGSGLRKMESEVKASFEKIGKDARAQTKLNEEATKNLEAGWKKALAPIKAAGIAMTAVGVIGSKMASDSRAWNAMLAGTAITLGKTTSEMRELVLEVTDVGLKVGETAATFEVLARAGVRSSTELKNATKAYDALGHAAGMDANVVADVMTPALKALGEEIPQTANELDAFTWLIKNTTVDLTDFASAMNYVAIYGDKLNVTSTDMVAMLAVLASRGIQGSAAVRRLRTATSEAADTGKSLNDVLNISQAELDTYKDKLSSATGITEKYAKAAETQYGFMDKLKQKWDEMKLRMSGTLSFLEPMLNVFVALGPMLVLLSMKIGLVTAATRALGMAVSFATGPVGILLAAASALGGLIWWVSKQGADSSVNIDKWTTSLTGAKDELKALEDAGQGTSDAATTLRQKIDDLNAALSTHNTITEKSVTDEKALAKMLKNRENTLSSIKALEKEIKDQESGIGASYGEGVVDPELQASQNQIDKWKAQLANMQTGVEALDQELLAQYKAMDDLSGAYKAAVDLGDTYLQNLILQAQRTKDATAATKAYDDAVKKINDTYGTSAASTAKTLVEIAQAESAALGKSLSAQLQSVKSYYSDVISRARSAYDSKIRLLNAETNATVKNLQAQIDALDEQDAADEEAKLREAVRTAWNRKDKADAEAALQAFLKQKQKTSLQAQISAVQDAAREKEQQWQDELDAFTNQKEAEAAIAESSIQNQLDGLESALTTKLSIIETERLAAIQKEADILAAVNARAAGEIAAYLRVQAAVSAMAANSVYVPTPTSAADMQALQQSPGWLQGITAFASGGIIREPTLLSSIRTGRPTGIMAEKGAEEIGPVGGRRGGGSNGGVTITGNTFIIREEADISKIASQLHRMRMLKGNFGAG